MSGLRGKDATGGTLVEGDRVEARYKGKGTKRFSGRISAVAAGVGGGETTFSIAYDDGDSESNARSENIWRTGPSKGDESAAAAAAAAATPAPAAAAAATAAQPSAAAAPLQGLDADGKALVVGDSVECRYKGKNKYYPGKVTALLPSVDGAPPLFSITYADGDFEAGAKGEWIRRLGPSLAEAAAAAATAAAPVTAATPSPADPETMRSGAAAAAAAAAPTAPSVTDTLGPRGADMEGRVLVQGDRVEARYKGKGTKFYSGTIAAVVASDDNNAPATFNLAYDDGDSEKGALGANVRRVGPSKAEALLQAAAPAASAAAEAAAPTAAPLSTPAAALPAVAEVAAAAAAPTPAAAAAAAAETPSAPLPLRGKDMEGKVLAQGDRIEALFKGKGKKYYPGRISAVLPPAAEGGPLHYDILFDDGDKDTGAKGEHIRRVGDSSAEEQVSAAAAVVAVAAEAVAATVAAAAPAATPTSVEALAGGVAASAQPTPSAAPAASTASSAAPEPSKDDAAAASAPLAPLTDTLGPRGKDMDGKVLVQGDRIEALFKGKGKKYYPGRISAVLPPAVEGGLSHYDILFDDGDKDTGAKGEHIRRTGGSKADEVVAAAAAVPAAATAPLAAAVAETVQAVQAPSESTPPTAAAAAVQPSSSAAPAPTAATSAAEAQPVPTPTVTAQQPAPSSAAAAAAATDAAVASNPTSSSSISSLTPAPTYSAVVQGAAAAPYPSPYSTPAPAAAASAPPTPTPTPAPQPFSTPIPSTSAPLSASLLQQQQPHPTPYAAPAPAAALHHLSQSLPQHHSHSHSHSHSHHHHHQPIALMGRLARELAAVRARAQPALYEAYHALARARVLSASRQPGSSSSSTLPPSPAEVMQWVLAALVAAQASLAMGGTGSSASASAALATLSAGSQAAPLIGTVALRDGLKRVGFSAGKDSLATLRSAFRVRSSSGAGSGSSGGGSGSGSGSSGGGGGEEDSQPAAIRAEQLAAYLCLEDFAAQGILERVDAESRARSGGGARPGGGVASTLPAYLGERGGGSSSGYYGSSGEGGAQAQGSSGGGSYSGYTTPPVGSTPQRLTQSSLAATLISGGSGRPPLPQGAGAAAGLMQPTAAGAGAAIPPSVGEWIRRHATQGERENLVAFMGLVADFQARNGLVGGGQSGGAAALAATGDSLVVPLGPSLRVGLRLYVP